MIHKLTFERVTPTEHLARIELNESPLGHFLLSEEGERIKGGNGGTSYYALGTMVDVNFHLLGQGHSGIVHLPSVVFETCVTQ